MIGTTVYAGFVITRKLGEGGMGEVFEAMDESLNKRIAIKVLLPEFSTRADVVERFVNEAKAAAALKHPNIIGVAAAGTLPDGRRYIALEFLEGSDLGGYLESWERLAPDRVLEILVQVCSALSLAHDKGIVHRDLKPDNIFITQTPNGRLDIKLLDFGIAKLSASKLKVGVRTITHQAMGTPQYMASEQARGLPTVNHLADIYSLGVITYKMLTGKLPFTGHSLADINYNQHNTPPADPREFANMPDTWAETILRTLSTEPANRPATAFEFARALWEAEPELRAVAKRCAPPGYIERIGATEETRKAPTPSAIAGASALTPATTPMAAARTQLPATQARWWIVAALVGAMGVVGATIAFRGAADKRPMPSTTSAAMAPVVFDAGVVDEVPEESSRADAAPPIDGSLPDAKPEAKPRPRPRRRPKPQTQPKPEPKYDPNAPAE